MAYGIFEFIFVLFFRRSIKKDPTFQLSDEKTIIKYMFIG